VNRGADYAREHPDVLVAVVQSAASDWAAARLAVAIERVAVALLAEDEPAPQNDLGTIQTRTQDRLRLIHTGALSVISPRPKSAIRGTMSRFGKLPWTWRMSSLSRRTITSSRALSPRTVTPRVNRYGSSSSRSVEKPFEWLLWGVNYGLDKGGDRGAPMAVIARLGVCEKRERPMTQETECCRPVGRFWPGACAG
jgi:hypothetical protein